MTCRVLSIENKNHIIINEKAFNFNASDRIAIRDFLSGADVALFPPSLRVIIVSNQLPLRIKRGPEGWEFEWDEDALVAQAKVGDHATACMGTYCR